MITNRLSLNIWTCFSFLYGLSVVIVASSHRNYSTCREWLLGFSGESCTQTCDREFKSCNLETLEAITNNDSFFAMVKMTRQLGDDKRFADSADFCNGGINTWPFATAPAIMSYHVYEKNEIALPISFGQNKTKTKNIPHINCFFPTKLIGDCDTKFQVPSAQRFCSCVNPDCVQRRSLRGEILSKF